MKRQMTHLSKERLTSLGIFVMLTAFLIGMTTGCAKDEDIKKQHADAYSGCEAYANFQDRVTYRCKTYDQQGRVNGCYLWIPETNTINYQCSLYDNYGGGYNYGQQRPPYPYYR